jgi:hypothetical protein
VSALILPCVSDQGKLPLGALEANERMAELQERVDLLLAENAVMVEQTNLVGAPCVMTSSSSPSSSPSNTDQGAADLSLWR